MRRACARRPREIEFARCCSGTGGRTGVKDVLADDQTIGIVDVRERNVGASGRIFLRRGHRVILGETVQKLNFPNAYNPKNAYNPAGSTFYTFGTGVGQALASSLYLDPNAQARRGIALPPLRSRGEFSLVVVIVRNAWGGEVVGW